MYANAQYLQNINGLPVYIRCDVDGIVTFLLADPANTDYANIMALVAAGELTIAPAENV